MLTGADVSTGAKVLPGAGGAGGESEPVFPEPLVPLFFPRSFPFPPDFPCPRFGAFDFSFFTLPPFDAAAATVSFESLCARASFGTLAPESVRTTASRNFSALFAITRRNNQRRTFPGYFKAYGLIRSSSDFGSERVLVSHFAVINLRGNHLTRFKRLIMLDFCSLQRSDWLVAPTVRLWFRSR